MMLTKDLLLLAALLATLNPCIQARTLAQAPSPEAELALQTGANTTTADVIVIGAGMAGITLARWLTDNTNYSVIILEARERSGGRLYSVPTAYGKKKKNFKKNYFSRGKKTAFSAQN